ncbi:dienelactone hydrolase family protein [Rheinheimera sp. 4Y26]|uniref:dienelactone hydrolase family protein n=1 Tax=Rheinheimera sp. 4Y26 TaxID=2977811 RepID=UPI0021B09EC3|nr:dienelactone hydrolase family protein [Rheinheimera sp. 4Y26]MCT6700528.1 dienelactone hydrolase family protein [Rheinheimera sp. 4Y26]
MQVQQTQQILPTATGPMLCRLFQPSQPFLSEQKPPHDEEAAVQSYPAILFYSEIFQITGPITRAATLLAGLGFLVLVPEIFHELNPQGTVLPYDEAGKNKGNQDKWQKPLPAHDSDVVAMLDYLRSLRTFNGKVMSYGVCIGGHLAFRAALNPAISAACCLYATDLHSDTLPALVGDQTLERAGEIKAELMLIWGKQDPHIPAEGRAKIYQTLSAKQVHFSWFEVNAAHAFMRDEGERYDPALALWVYQQARDLFLRQ